MSHTGDPKNKPATAAHVPETPKLHVVIDVRPQRSANTPANTLPAPPAAITPKPATRADAVRAVREDW